MRLGLLANFPVPEQAPLFRALAKRSGLSAKVYFAHRPTPEDPGMGLLHSFLWREDPARGFDHDWLHNTSIDPGLHHFGGISTPTIHDAWKRDRPDYVVIPWWDFRSSLQAMSAAQSLGIPYALWCDLRPPPHKGPLSGWGLRFFQRRFIRQADRVLAVGARATEHARRLGAQDVTALPPFIDAEGFAIPAKAVGAEEARTKWDLPPDKKIILFSGKLEPCTRPQMLLEQCSRRPRPDWHLFFVGEGSLRSPLEEAARQSNLPTTFGGVLDPSEMPAAFRASDVLVVPSGPAGAWGRSPLEAMACSCPILLSSACHYAPDLAVHPDTSIIFPSEEPDTLGAMLDQLLKGDTARARLAAAGLQRVRHWSPESVADQILRDIAKREPATTASPAQT